MKDQESKSLLKLSIHRLRRNPIAMAGFTMILIYLMVAIAGPFIRLDKTPKANDQYLELSIKRPGFKVLFFQVANEVSEQSLWSQWLYGREKTSQSFPIYRYELLTDSILVERYTGDDVNNGELLVYAYNDLVSSNQLELHPSNLREQIKKELISNTTFWLGTDRYGRDVLSRLMAGTWVSFTVGAISILISLIIGIVVGAIAGYYRGRVDDLLVWLINVVWSIPTLLLVIAIALALGKGFWQVFVAVGLTMWVEVARVVRGQVISLREKEFIEAGKALGYTHSRIIKKHVLPNVIGPVIVISAANFASAILVEAGLSFLGLGAQPPQATWGKMISEHKGYVITGDAYLAILPGVAIFFLVFAFVLLGNGLRDALDTKA
ncbi:ABC transporter permease [Acidiluteibacter ferrifornacis]|uniref:ABC transporter permease subunit n=1 Tax=Acidiluteibacter ferrifornacis TaxID=2692424 RepID=A0A6N9NHA3_9FLAO|nr:ABC transporter permease [Acidiluteibacter ferrifornacis]NBG65293.1 ABC transporter permease subunit [Acidiluteibacter ferrifornacis]